MKLLLDENLSHRLVSRLMDAFPGTAHVAEVELRAQADTSIWDYAAQEDFIIVSKDDDFRQLSFLRGHPPKVIWLMVGNVGTDAIAALLLRSRERISAYVDRAEDALLILNLDD